MAKITIENGESFYGATIWDIIRAEYGVSEKIVLRKFSDDSPEWGCVIVKDCVLDWISDIDGPVGIDNAALKSNEINAEYGRILELIDKNSVENTDGIESMTITGETDDLD